MNIITWIIVGAIAGVLADAVIKGIQMKLFGKIIVGIVGGILGGWIFDLLGIGSGNFLWTVISAFVGAIIVLIILRAVRGKK